MARQHPGEAMAEYFMEGMLRALLDPYHGLSKELLKKAVFYVVRLSTLHSNQSVALLLSRPRKWKSASLNWHRQ